MLDFHNHLIPGVDDGAADIGEARLGLQAMVANGITAVVATPHITASLRAMGKHQPYFDAVERGWQSLKNLAESEFPSLRLERGFEVMLDTPRVDLSDPAMRLAGSAFALVEFPYMRIPPNSTFVLRELSRAGYRPVVAHPERYANIAEHPGILDEWRAAGAFLQINSGSLVGQYGSRIRETVWELLAAGIPDFISSDYHSRGKCTVAAALDAMKRRGYEGQVDSLRLNGERILEGELPVRLAPAVRKAERGWRRLLPWA